MKVIYITGWLRSGSTILGNVLNELPGVLHAGELHYLWKNGMLDSGTNSLCGCGEQIRQCALWSSVIAAFGDDEPTQLARQMMAWQQAGLRTRHTRARLASTPDPRRRGAGPHRRGLSGADAARRGAGGRGQLQVPG